MVLPWYKGEGIKSENHHNQKGKNLLLGGFYREWSRKGDETQESQPRKLKILSDEWRKQLTNA